MLRKLISFRPFWLSAALVTWIAFSCVPIATGLLNQAVFNALPASTPSSRLVLLFVAIVVLTLVGPALATLWFWVHTTMEPMIEALVRTNFADWVVNESGRTGKRESPVTLLGHVRDDVPNYTGLVNEWYRILGEAVFVAVALTIMFSVDAFITLMVFVPLAGVVVLTHWARARLPNLVGRKREATVAVTNFIGDVFGGVQTIKAFGAERGVIRRFEELNRHRAAAEVRNQVTEARIDAITEATVAAGRGLVLLIGASAMLRGDFSVGDFMLFAVYLDWMLQLPRRLGRLLSQQKTSQKSRARLQDALGDAPVTTLVRHRPVYLLELPPPVEPAPPVEPFTDLCVEGLTYRYTGETQGIFDVTFTVPRGTVTVITGELGSGKSTLLEVLLGLRIADSGQVRWNGGMVADPATFLVPPRTAYKPQLPRLFSDTVADNVRLGWDADPPELDRALSRSALDDDLHRMPDGLDTLVGPRGVRLSGGQVQRVSMARMFVRDCQLYVIDDFSSALDDETEQEVWAAIDESRVGAHTTYLMVSHRAAALRRADQIVVMRGGRVTHQGTPEELAAVSPAVRTILGTTPKSSHGE